MADVNFLVGINLAGPVNLNQNEIRNAVIQVLSSDPVSPVAGQFWYRSDLTPPKIKYYDGTSVHTIDIDGAGGGSLPDASTTVKGVVKLSTAPASATEPIAVGTNDTRLTTASEITGTTQTSFQVDNDNSGPRIKNASGVLQVRNADDDAYADFRADDVVVENTLTIGGLSATRKYTQQIGNGSSTSIGVTHNLGTRDITWKVRNNSTHAFVETQGEATDANTLTLSFNVAPTSNQFTVIVTG